MMQAIWEGRHDIMECLLRFEPTVVNTSCPKGLTPLMVAAVKGDVPAIEFLIERGSAIDQKDTKKRTALMRGVQAGNVESVKALCRHGADLNICDQNGCTVLMIASKRGHFNVLRFIIEKVFCVDSVDSDGMSALMHAAKAGHVRVIKLLDSKRSANKNLSDRNGHTALIWASKKGHISTVKLLLEMGCDVNAVDHEGWTALMHGVMGEHFEVVTLLITHADTNASIKMGYTAVMLASVRNNTAILDSLLSVDTCVVDGLDHVGWTPLMHAVVERKYESVKRLCGCHADSSVCCPAGMTAMKLALARNDNDLIDLLVQYGGCSKEIMEAGMEGISDFDDEKRNELADYVPILRKKTQIRCVRETIISKTSASNNTEVVGRSKFDQGEDTTGYEAFLSHLSAHDRRILSQNNNVFQNRGKTEILDWMSECFPAAEASTVNSSQRKSSISSLWVSFASVTEGNERLEDFRHEDSPKSSRTEVASSNSSRSQRNERNSYLLEKRSSPTNNSITLNISNISSQIVTYVTNCENLTAGEFGQINCNKTETICDCDK